MTPQEEWRPVVGWDGLYEVSDLGRVRTVERLTSTGHRSGGFRVVRARIRKLFPNGGGYLHVTLAANGRKGIYLVHRLVAEAFIGERPDGMEICHNNGDSADNRLVNLRYDTPTANRHDIVRHGRHWGANRTHCPAGHPYDETNTDIRPTGARRCRACHRERERTRRKASVA